MPEQSEWQPDTDNAGDYRWHPEYALSTSNIRTETAGGYVRRSIDSLRPQSYDTRTLGERIAVLEAEVNHLRNIVHKYINQDGTL